MKHILSILAVTTLATALAGCDQKTSDTATAVPETTQVTAAPAAKTSPKTVSVHHTQGTTEVNQNPTNPVIFDFGTLDTMHALGITTVAGLPKKNIPSYLSQYNNDKVANAGNMKQPDMQAIRDLKPELIVITGRQGKSYDELATIAPTINLSINNGVYLDSFKKNVLTIGQIFDKTAEADNGLAVLDKKITELRKQAEASGQKAMVLVHYNGKFSASTSNGYASIIHQVLGVKKADENLADGRQAGTPDYIAEKNPDIIFIVDRNEAIGEGKVDRSLMEDDKIKQTNAFRKGKIVYLQPDLWYLSGGGLESLSLQIDEVNAAIQ
ncbi:siderophore ABC transporter substrate-binding protein [Pragia fontium]|uniref:Iron complex transport system substrate-binding protein n=1 Tax=Pragia fontium DSM 5563 = ATCC 49100 TaxID=1122977 RepID=A0AAJ4WA29_9GAMM|nr:ABC transporter substrate-binding protein [Pragia fontium]SFC67910.1 iron complex transport system substrate-binding protein [Pragia fontium DSM 5563 = ATCC 49100]VEJ56422.1 Uncharacterized ABC transporter solute-binding protein yclQ precursor [Pragia fontium]